MSTLKVFSKPGCGKCVMAKRFLKSEGVAFEPIDITKQPETIEQYGISSLPVIVLENEDGLEVDRVNGFEREELEVVIQEL